MRKFFSILSLIAMTLLVATPIAMATDKAKAEAKSAKCDCPKAKGKSGCDCPKAKGKGGCDQDCSCEACKKARAEGKDCPHHKKAKGSECPHAKKKKAG